MRTLQYLALNGCNEGYAHHQEGGKLDAVRVPLGYKAHALGKDHHYQRDCHLNMDRIVLEAIGEAGIEPD